MAKLVIYTGTYSETTLEDLLKALNALAMTSPVGSDIFKLTREAAFEDAEAGLRVLREAGYDEKPANVVTITLDDGREE